MSKPDLAGVTWRKSSRSAASAANCVEVAFAASSVAVRDSKDPDGPALRFGLPGWTGFLHSLGSGGFDDT